MARAALALGAVARLPRPARGLAGRVADPEHRQLSDRLGSAPRDPIDPRRQGITDQYPGVAAADGVRIRHWRDGFDSFGVDDGPLARRGVVLQSAVDGDLSGAEGGADADHHALARRRRRRQDACLLYTSPSPRDGLLSRM